VPASIRRDVRLRTRPVRSLNAESKSPILCETEALPSSFGVRVAAIDSLATVDGEEIMRALLRLVFEEHVVVIDHSIGRELFEPTCTVAGSRSKTCRLDRITDQRKAMCAQHNVEVESGNAGVRFIDMQAAYEALPQRYKNRIDDLKVCHCAPSETMLYRAVASDELLLSQPVQPLAPSHPFTNRRLLSPDLERSRIVGLPDESGLRILEELTKHSRQSRFLYEHRKGSNEIVVWDATTTFNATYYDVRKTPPEAALPTGCDAESHDLHPAYRVVLRPERSASSSAP